MSLGESIVAVLWFGVLGNSFMNGCLDVEASGSGVTKSSFLIETKLLFKFHQSFHIGIPIIMLPSPWFLNFMFKLADLPECPLDIHDI